MPETYELFAMPANEGAIDRYSQLMKECWKKYPKASVDRCGKRIVDKMLRDGDLVLERFTAMRARDV